VKICYFGTYSTQEGYPRNNVIIKGLRKNGVEVIECHIELWKGSTDKLQGIKTVHYNLKLISRVIHAYSLLIVKFFQISDYDVLIVGFAGHFDIFLAKFLNLFRKRLLVFDAFISLYDTAVNDRKIVLPHSLKARLLWLIDKYACSLADLVLLDTGAHINYFVNEFRLKPDKFLRIPVGEDDEIFKPANCLKKSNKFNVVYFGTYLPLHGTEFIVQAAGLLQDINDIHFILVGSGPDYDNINNLAKNSQLKNVEFITDWQSYNELKEIISQADICLGIFGTTEKAKRVVPSKVFVSLAMAKPIITGDSLAVREFLRHRDNALLCKMGDAHAIKQGILTLKNDERLMLFLANNGYEYFKNNFSPQKIGERLLVTLEKAINRG
jgi:glycosyltransferase involved in cell wall biosynthesis